MISCSVTTSHACRTNNIRAKCPESLDTAGYARIGQGGTGPMLPRFSPELLKSAHFCSHLLHKRAMSASRSLRLLVRVARPMAKSISSPLCGTFPPTVPAAFSSDTAPRACGSAFICGSICLPPFSLLASPFSHKKISQNKANSTFVCNAGSRKQTQANPIFGFDAGVLPSRLRCGKMGLAAPSWLPLVV